MTEKQLLRQREIRAEELGEGHWMNLATKEWCPVEVAFYPKVNLYITEAGKRRKITRAELDREYKRLEL